MPEYEILDVGDFANDPDSDDLLTGGTKINTNFGRLFPQNVPFQTTLDFSGSLKYAAQTLGGVTELDLGASYIRGGRVLLELTGGGIRLPGEVKVVSGYYDPDAVNLIEIVNQGGVTSSSADLVASIVNRDAAPLTGIVLRQRLLTRSELFSSFSEALSSNPGAGDPGSTNKFSRMGELEKFRAWDGYFYFRLKYFNGSAIQQGSDIVWRQRSNPVVAINSVDDFLALAGVSQLNFARDAGGTAEPGGLCLQAFNSATTWTMYPDEFDAQTKLNGTLGSTSFSVALTTPGINATDVIAQLSCEGAL